jgi:hypothetical protein
MASVAQIHGNDQTEYAIPDPTQPAIGALRMDRPRGYQSVARWLFFALALLNALDFLCTATFITRYGTSIETNPTVVALYEHNSWDFAYVKLAISAVMILIGIKWARLKKWMAFAIAPPALIYCYVVGMSLYLLATLPP